MKPTQSNPSSSAAPDAPPKKGIFRTLLGPAVALVLLAVIGRLAGGYWPAVEAKVAELGPVGYLLFCAAWVLLSSACFPVSVLGISAGVLFGLPLGIALVFVSAMLAAALMFALGRGLLRARIREMIATRPKLAAVDRLAGEKALRLNALTRLSPLNYGLACYTLAAGRTNFVAYMLGNLATVPSMVLQVWVGTLVVETGKSFTGDGLSPRNLLLLGGGLVFMGILMWQISRLIRQAIAEVEQ